MEHLPQMTEKSTQFGLARQGLLCLCMCAVAWSIWLLAGRRLADAFISPLSPSWQVATGAILCTLVFINGVASYRFYSRGAVTRHTIDSYSRLDLRGWNPVLLAAAAGFGEEILFRGVLQPLLGITASSVLFVIAHTRAYRFRSLSRRVFVQAGGILAVSLVLAFVARYAGLWVAIATHIAIDIAGLYTVRSALGQKSGPGNSFQPKPVRRSA